MGRFGGTTHEKKKPKAKRRGKKTAMWVKRPKKKGAKSPKIDEKAPKR